MKSVASNDDEEDVGDMQHMEHRKEMQEQTVSTVKECINEQCFTIEVGASKAASQSNIHLITAEVPQLESLRMLQEDYSSVLLEKMLLKQRQSNQLEKQKMSLLMKFEKILSRKEEAMKQTIEEKRRAYEGKMEALVAECEEAKGSLTEIKMQYNQLTKELNDKTMNMQKLESAYRSYKASFRKENERLVANVANVTEELKMKERQLELLKQDHELYVVKMNASIDSAASLCMDASNKDVKITELMGNVDRLTSLCDRLENTNTNLSTELENQSKMVKEGERTNEELREKISKYEAEMKQTKHEFDAFVLKQLEAVRVESEANCQKKLNALRRELMEETLHYASELAESKAELASKTDALLELQNTSSSGLEELSDGGALQSKVVGVSSTPAYPSSNHSYFDTTEEDASPNNRDSTYYTEKALPSLNCISCVTAREDLLTLRKYCRDNEREMRLQKSDMKRLVEQNAAIKSELRSAEQKLRATQQPAEQSMYLRNVIKKICKQIPHQMDAFLEDLIKVLYTILEFDEEEVKDIEGVRPAKANTNTWNFFKG